MLRSWRALTVWLSVAMAMLPNDARAQPSDGLSAAAALEHAITQVIEQAEPSVVSVARFRLDPNDPARSGVMGRRIDRGPSPDAQEPRDLLPNQFGAGVIVAPAQSDDRFVLTAYHVVRGGPIAGQPGSGDGSEIKVWFPSGHDCAATIYAADPRCDLAVLQLDYKGLRLKPAQLRPMSWSSAEPVRKGQFVVTLSNPYWIARDGSASAAWGIVSNLVRRPAALAPHPPGGPQTLFGLATAIQVEQRLPIGSSGGPVINLRGELVGIASSLAAIEGYERSGGFAIPLDATTRWMVETLLAGREVEYGLLGVTPGKERLENALAEKLRQSTAALVVDARRGMPAEAAGLREGDLIVAVDGQPTRSDLDLMRQVTLHPPETAVQLTVYRRGAELTVKVKLGKWPVADPEGIVATQHRFPVWRGVSVDYPTVRPRVLAGLAEIPTAVLVTEVVPDSAAHAAGLQTGEFITHVKNTSVKTPAEFADAVKSLKGEVTLRFHSGDGQRRTVTIKE
jgi:serine protease Do